MSAPSPAKRRPADIPRDWRAFCAGEMPWFLSMSCLVGGLVLLINAARCLSEDKWLLATFSFLFAVGCIWSWRVLRRMTPADIGLEG